MNQGKWQMVLPGNSILEERPANSEELEISDFSLGSDGFGFLAASPKQKYADNASPQIIELRPDGTLSYEQIPQVNHTTLTSISNLDANHALALGEQQFQIATQRGLSFYQGPVLLSYMYDLVQTGP